MQKYGIDIIGTHIDIMLDTDDSILELSREIESRLTQFEAKYSRFISGNWLHTLNLEHSGILDRDGKNMLSMMLNIASKTKGYFDPTIGKRLTELGYGNKSNQSVIARHEAIHVSKNGDYRDIEIVGDQVILHGDIELEFGGIGKGYLIDVIKEMIDSWYRAPYDLYLEKMIEGGWPESSSRKANIKKRYLINFGGDMYGCGGWNIGLESPFARDEVIGTIKFIDLFLACSAGTKRKWGDHHHLIDPHTGESARDVIASYIEGESGMMTDGYATALCVMPWDLACTTFERTPEISGVLVSKDGDIYQKEGSRSEVFE